MSNNEEKTIVVVGATGRQGQEIVPQLLKDKWKVRAMTRKPESEKALALAKLGAELVKADLDDKASIDAAFQGAYGIYDIQVPIPGKQEIEVRQGKAVADAAKKAEIKHLVYGAAGIGKPTGIEQWDAKIEIWNYMKELGLPITVLRPQAFMELMTDPAYYPQSSTWYVWPKLSGSNRKMPFISVQDIAVIVARVFANPDQYIGKNFMLASDVKTLDECRSIYTEVMGKKPPRFPMPMFLFNMFVGKDIPRMWEWLAANDIDLDTSQTREIDPEAMTVREWLQKMK